MIAKNKQSPATLYLLNAKNSTQRQEEERKSARLTFNKKKSARSISQYPKWNPSQNKETLIGNNNMSNNINNNQNQGQFYQPSSRTNSEMKKIALSRNQFGMEPMPIEKKLSSIIEIFKSIKYQEQLTNKNHEQISKRISTLGYESQIIIDNKSSKKSQQEVLKSGEVSLLSLKEMKEQSNHSHSRGGKMSTAHRRTESMLNHADQERTNKNSNRQSHQIINQNSSNNTKNNNNESFENIVSKIECKFKAFEKNSEDWRIKYSMEEADYLIDDMLKVFKMMFNELTANFSNYMTNNLTFYEESITEIAKDYEMQICMLQDEIDKNHNVSSIIETLVKEVNEKHCKGQICSKIFEDIQLHGTNIEHYIKTSDIYGEIHKLTEELKHQTKMVRKIQLKPYDLEETSMIVPCEKNISNLNMLHSDDDDFYEEEKNDYVEQDSNWNDHFQNRESIKGVLKYIHNHKENKLIEKNHSKGNLNSTGYLMIPKDKNDMKIDNWKSFEDKSINQYKKIKSQR